MRETLIDCKNSNNNTSLKNRRKIEAFPKQKLIIKINRELVDRRKQQYVYYFVQM